MADAVDFDPSDPIWKELGDILDKKFATVCQVCGAEAKEKTQSQKYPTIDMKVSWKEWRCTECDWIFRSLYYWEIIGEKAPVRWKIERVKANLAELILEFRRSSFWQKALGPHRLLASSADRGRAYVTVEEVFNFLEDIVTSQFIIDEDGKVKPPV